MNAHQAFELALSQGVHLYTEQGKLKFKAPAGGMTAELRAALSAHKDALLQLLSTEHEPVTVPLRCLQQSSAELSFSQRRLWFLQQLHGASGEYNIPQALQIDGDFQPALATQVLNTIVQRHQILHSLYADTAEGARQYANADLVLQLQTEDLSALPDATQQARLQALLSAHAFRPFDLTTEMPLRVCYILLRAASAQQPQRGVLLLNLHHIAADGWSMDILQQEFIALYSARLSGQPLQLPELPVQYSDYVAWQLDALQADKLAQQLEYWTTQLDDLPALHSLPLDYARPAQKNLQGAVLQQQLAASAASAVQQLARQLQLTPFMLLHAVLALVLARLSHSEELVIGTPVANRPLPEMAPLIGYFANTLVLRTRTSHASLGDYLQHVKTVHLAAQAHQDLPFEQLAEQLKIVRSSAYSPLFQLMLTVNSDYGTPQLSQTPIAGLQMTPLAATAVSCKFDLEVEVVIQDSGLLLDWVYDTALFHADTVQHFASCFDQTLQALLALAPADFSQPLHRLSMLTPAQTDALLHAPHQHDAEPLPYQTIQQWIAAQTQHSPERPALCWQGQPLSYAMLDQQADALAAYLQQQCGVGPQTLVGLCIGRSPGLLVAMLAVLKAGAAYVPLDPAYPAARLQYMVDDTGLALLLTDDATTALCHGFAAPQCCLNAALQAQLSPGARPDPAGQNAASLAYVMYTSGSTGQPKGVMVSQHNLLHYARHCASRYQLTPADRVLQFSTMNFDIFVEEWLCALTQGACLVLRDEMLALSRDVFIEFCRTHAITVASLPTAYWHQLALTAAELQSLDLRLLIVGGEALDLQTVRQLKPGFVLLNTYGPTETTITASSYLIRDHYSGAGAVPIGRPNLSTGCLVLAPDLSLCPAGIAGELHISGQGLASGYLRQPELSQQRFITNPYYTPQYSYSSPRLYKTGDLVRWSADGELEFIGRRDSQIKIRGFRIEPGEIEQQICAVPAVDSALVVAVKNAKGQYRLLAYLKAATSAPTLIATVQSALKASLPDYMLPSGYALVDSWPLTANGKIDKNALPAVDTVLPAEQYQPPQGAAELCLAQLFAELLELPQAQISASANFFELGGHSLLLMELGSRLKRHGYQASIAELFNAASLQDMAAQLSVYQPAPAAGASLIPAGCQQLTPQMVPLVSLTSAELAGIAAQIPGGAANIQDIYPLAPLQQGIFLIHSLQQGSDPYVSTIQLVFADAAALAQFVADLNFVIARHDVLRTAVLWRGRDEPVQVVLRQATVQPVLLPFSQTEGVAAALAHEVAHGCHRLDLERAPLLSLEVAQDAADGKFYALLKEHHLMLDHVSLAVLMQELALDAASRAALPPPLPYRHFIAGTLQRLASLDVAGFFGPLLGDITSPTLPFGLADVSTGGLDCTETTVTLPELLATRIRQLSKAQSLSPAALFHLAWAMVVSACSQSKDVVFGTVLSGRMNGMDGVDRMLGLMINTLPVRVQLQQDAASLLQTMQQQLKDLLPYEQVSLAQAQRYSGLPAGQPLFSAMLNYRHSRPTPAPDDGASQVLHIQERTNYPFCLSVDDWQQQFSLHFVIDRSVGAPVVADYMLCALERLTEALTEASPQPVAALSVLPELIQQQLLAMPLAAEVSSEPQLCIHELFEQAVQRYPDQIALVHAGQTLTYRQLNARANQLAHYLRAQYQLQPDLLVGLCLGRSVQMLVGLLAILKAGAAYVPLDPLYPAERLAFIAADAGLTLVLTDAETEVTLAGADWLVLDDSLLMAAVAAAPDTNLPVADIALRAQHLAYVIYTSGSTGQPKGVLQTHQNISRLFAATAADFAFGANDCWCLFHSFAFDFSVWEIWGALIYGGKLLVPSRQDVQDPQRFVALCQRENLSVLNQTPSAFKQLCEYLADSGEQLPALQYVVFGGEGLSDSHLALWWQHFAHHPAQLINMYGITETTVHVTYQPVVQGQPISIGRPLRDQHILLLDTVGNLVVPGCAGEIYVAGAGLARGYLNRAELTAERFIANPFYARQPALGERLYKAGDLARLNAAGQLEYLGRQDDQVKIRGHRIELGEVEHRVAQLPALDSAVVLAVPARDGQLQLVAYVKPADAGALPADWSRTIRQALSAVLPDYMCPALVVPVSQWPLTRNGKIDKKALPAAELSGAVQSFVAPGSALEHQLVVIWSQVLDLPAAAISVDASFFELGGHSLLLIRLLGAIRRELQAELTVQDIFSAATVRQQADKISQGERAEALPRLPLLPRSSDAALPLSFAQQRLWFIDQLNDGSAEYHLPLAYQVSGALDLPQLERALGQIVARHEILRTVYLASDDGPIQQIMPAGAFSLSRHDLSGLPAAQQDAAVTALRQADAAEAFRLDRDLMLRASYILLAPGSAQQPQQGVLLLCLHHIAADGWSLDVLMQELQQLMLAAGPLPPLALQYADYALWQRQWLQGEVLTSQLQYWQQQLADLPLLHSLQPDLPRPEVKQHAAGLHRVTLPATLMDGLTQLAAHCQMTPFMLVHAACALLLGRHGNQPDVVMGTPVASRAEPALEPLIGFFTNTLVLRVNTGAATIADYLAQVKAVHAAALSHQDLPFEQLVDALKVPRSEAYSPLFQLMLTMDQGYGRASGAAPALPGITLRPCEALVPLSAFDLEIHLASGAAGLTVHWLYDLALFSAARIEMLSRHLAQILTSFAALAQPAAARQLASLSLDQIGMLSDAEITQQLLTWNDTAVPYPAELCIQQLFEQQVARTPDAVALEFEGQTLSYQALNQQANQLAHYLRAEHGVGPDVLVGLCCERSVAMVVGLLGILKAGGAYVPLDPDYPPARLAYLQQDAAVRLVLSQQAVATRLGLVDAVLLDVADHFTAYATDNIDVAATGQQSSQLAYVIYTSGSTGQPKGVLNTHRALHNRVDWMDRAYQCSADDKILQKTPFSFDVSVWEFIWPLVKGARLVLARPGGHKEPDYLNQLIRSSGITKLHFVPSMLGLMLEHGALWQCDSLKQVFCSGEALQISHVEQFKQQLPAVALHNLYGPTEAAIDVSYWDCRGDYGHSIPIGRPIQNIRLYILDADLALLPVGAAGELYIGGDGLARGYLNKDTLTAERFVANPYHVAGQAGSSERLYRTGDLVRYRPDGNIEYLGRLDHQVKLRGFRIELGEIEALLCRDAAVDSALVMAQGELLVAYVKPNGTVDFTQLQQTLQAELSAALPAYMVPSAFVAVAEWPLSANGKTDRKALPAVALCGAEAGDFIAPSGDTELLLAEIWAGLLGMAASDISANASFFALGGHSLLVMKLVQQIDQVFRTRGIAISTVVQAPTLTRMAAAINSHNQLSWQPLTLLSPDAAPGCVTEVYLAPGAGMTSGGYLDLAAAMPQVQFICLEPAGSHDSTSAIDDWEQLISTYADAVLARQPAAGPRRLIHLLGHSSGGAVAFALAARLESSGCNVRLILCECLIATAATPQFRISAAQKTELMQAYARELKPDASAAQIDSWLELPLTQQLFEVYFRQVDWAESYRPAQVLNASTYLLLTPEQPASYWQVAIDAMQPYLRQPVQVIKTDGEHVSMIKSPHVRTLAARLGAVLGGPTQHDAL